MSSGRGKRSEGEAAEVASFGPFRLFPTERRLERDGVPVDVGGRALDILLELVKQAGKVVSKAELMAAIWTDITVGEGGVRYVTSVAGRGYCFVAPVVLSPREATSHAARKSSHGLPPRLARMAG